jgi:hypothetical protein
LCRYVGAREGARGSGVKMTPGGDAAPLNQTPQTPQIPQPAWRDLRIRYEKLDELREHPDNPNQHSAEQIQRSLKQALRFNNYLLAEPRDKVVAG